MIELAGVSKAYGDVVALDDVHMTVERGQIHGIVGPSGAGKSTLVRCLTGLEKPDDGTIMIDDLEITGLTGRSLQRARLRIGMVFQAVNLLEQRTAAQNIAYPLKIAGVPAAQIQPRVEELLELVGLAGRGNAYPVQLSGGQAQRVGIARALAATPSVLLCDEPTSALDSASTHAILDLIHGIRDALGVTVLIITHEMDVVRRICDSVTLLDHGRVAESGTIEDVVSDPTTRLSRSLVPLPTLPDDVGPVLDVFFTSHPGEPTGSRVFNAIADLGGDITAATFETLGSVQIGRVALSAPRGNIEELEQGLRTVGLHVEGMRA